LSGDEVLAHRPNPQSGGPGVWVLSFDLSCKVGPTSSYATDGIALRIIAPRKPPYPAKDDFVKVEIPQGGNMVLNNAITSVAQFSSGSNSDIWR